MREIVLDTESTGFEPSEGHRVVEIGCLELINKMPTGRIYHQYINPERDMPEAAFNVHGLSEDFLKDYPLFREIYPAFLDFIEDSPLVIHNARFDMKFLNAELDWARGPKIPFGRAIDTLFMARQQFPGSPANLDALCRRFNVDNTGRKKHGALLDAELLAEVYLELCGGRQTALGFSASQETQRASDQKESTFSLNVQPRVFKVSEEEKVLHTEFLKKLKNPIWQPS